MAIAAFHLTGIIYGYLANKPALGFIAFFITLLGSFIESQYDAEPNALAFFWSGLTLGTLIAFCIN